MTNPKAKGSQFERVVCKSLSLWVSKGKQDDLFWRSSMSGGRATIGFSKGVKRKSQAGDISAIHSMGQGLIDRFVIECKNVKDLKLQEVLLYGTVTTALCEYWEKLMYECAEVNKQPMLIGKSNLKPPVIILSGDVAQNLDITKDGLYVIWSSSYNVYVFLYDQFIQLYTYKDLIKAYPSRNARTKLKVKI